jgi:hypothetical protein
MRAVQTAFNFFFVKGLNERWCAQALIMCFAILGLVGATLRPSALAGLGWVV